MRFVYLILAVLACVNGAWIIGEGVEALGVLYLCLGFCMIGLSKLSEISQDVRLNKCNLALIENWLQEQSERDLEDRENIDE